MKRSLKTRVSHFYVSSRGALFLGIVLLALSACNNAPVSSNRDGLPTSIVSNPRSADGMDTVAEARKPTMDFQDSVHDFGTIHEDEVVVHEFNFTNNGKTPLIIASAAGSCGCTVASYPHDPVQPGATAVMKVTFNSAGKTGHHEKAVTIHANTMKYTHMLYIKATIESK